MGGSAGFLVFTIVALAGIAITNVLMPAFIKTHFPRNPHLHCGLLHGAHCHGVPFLRGGCAHEPQHEHRLAWRRWLLGFVGCACGGPPLGSSLPCRRSTGLRWVTVLRLVTVPAPSGAANADITADADVAAHTGANAPGNTAAASAAVDADAANAAAGAEPAKLWVMSRSKKACALALSRSPTLDAFVQMGWLAQIFRDYGVSKTTPACSPASCSSSPSPAPCSLPRY
ncbi:MAG: hypothetical protein U1U88_001283 [Lawsonella clevelandensis]